MLAGIEMIYVPYRGGGAVMSDLLGGQVQVLFGTTSLTVEQIRAGKLRALAVTSAIRWRGYHTSRPWATSSQVTKPALYSASVHRGNAC